MVFTIHAYLVFKHSRRSNVFCNPICGLSITILWYGSYEFCIPNINANERDYKRIPWFVVMAGLVILAGHYIDVFNMIMPATVGDRWFIGIPEISAIMLFAGLFIFVVFTALTKAPLLAKRYPFRKESEEFHY